MDVFVFLKETMPKMDKLKVGLSSPAFIAAGAAIIAFAAIACYFKLRPSADLLPPDYASILFRAVDPVEYSSEEELFFRLCDHPLLIDGGMMSFGLDYSSGAKCFMISARALSIIWGDHDRYWQWIAQPESRFSECAELIEVCWLAISKTIDSNVLTAHTAYAAYLVFKLEPNAHGLSNPVQTAKITVDGDTVSEHFVCLDVREGEPPYPWWGYDIEEIDDVILPSERQDGWWEVQLGEFYSGDGIDGEVGMSFAEIRGGHWKSGLIVEGIEVRPKNNSARKYNIIFDCDRLIVICKDYCRRLIV